MSQSKPSSPATTTEFITTGQTRVPSARAALAGLALAMLLSSLGTSGANVALPAIARSFSASLAQVQWVVLAYLLAVTVAVVSMGRLGDVLGARRLLLGGLAAFAAASVLCGAAPTLGVLIAARSLQGLAAAVLMALSISLVAETAGPERTGRAMGLVGTMSAVGTALGPSLGGALTAAAGWRAAFLMHVPLALLAFHLIFFHVPARSPAPGRKAAPASLDLAGALWLALTLAAYALAMTPGPGSRGPWTLALLLVAATTVILFFRAESTAASPLVPPFLLRMPALAAALVTNMLVSTVIMTTLVVGPFYLTSTLHLDAAAAGLVMSSGPVVAALTGVPAGRLVDRLGAWRMILTGLLGMTSACALLAVLPATCGVIGYMAPLAAITAAYALFQTSNNTASMKRLPTGERGVVSGMLALARNIGLITGASVMGMVFAQAAAVTDPTSASPTAVAAGMRTTFGVAAVLAATALLVAWRGSHGARPVIR